jgi:hypothetical protein
MSYPLRPRPKPPEERGQDSEAKLEARLRRGRAERVRASLSALGRRGPEELFFYYVEPPWLRRVCRIGLVGIILVLVLLRWIVGGAP